MSEEAGLDLSPMDTPESPTSHYSPSPTASPQIKNNNSDNINSSSNDSNIIVAHDSSEDGSKTSTCLRLLVSNSAAGSVIGKGGATINEFQAQSGARIQLSRNQEFFPGTSDRIIQITGTTDEILKATNLILSKLMNEIDDNNEMDERTTQVRLVLPNSVCGGIIGKGGSTIKSYVEDSQANIKLSSQDHNPPGVTDRLVNITGTLQQQIRAIFLILSKVAEDPAYAQYMNAPLSYSGASLSGMQGLPAGYSPLAYGLPSYGAGIYGIGTRNNKGMMPPLVPLQTPLPIRVPVVTNNAITSLTMAVPDERVGALVGRGGRTILEIQQVSGSRIKISERGDFISGTNDRQVTITGAMECVQLAQQLVEQKLYGEDR